MDTRIDEIIRSAEDELPTPLVVRDRYRLVRRIGRGSFSQTFEAEDAQSDQKLCVKVETCATSSRRTVLQHEYNVYRRLNGVVGIPEVYWLHSEMGHYMMGMQLLGLSLNRLRINAGGVLSAETVLDVGAQMFRTLRGVHDRGLIHRDVKPENFLIGLAENNRQVYLTDFGLAALWQDPVTMAHQRMSTGSFAGTLTYSSLNTDTGFQQSRRDDLESFVYVLIALLKGALPWSHLYVTNRKVCSGRLVHAKMNCAIEKLCASCPKEFCLFLQYVRALRFEEAPDYDLLESYLTGPLASLSSDAIVYEWEKESDSLATEMWINNSFA